MGLSDDAINAAYKVQTVSTFIGSFTDIFPITTKHDWLWFEMMMLIRIAKPTILRLDGRQLECFRMLTTRRCDRSGKGS
jgi:hypothetical protein